MLEFCEISKTFKSDLLKKPFEALKNVSFNVPEGKIIGFLGANGAGKTTSIKVAMDFIRPTSGEIKFGKALGGSKKEAFKYIGYLPERPFFYPHLTGREFCHYMGALTELKRSRIVEQINKWGPRFKIDFALDREIRTYSKGMLQRIGFLATLLHDPRLIMLDEPIAGVDPIGRKEFRELILDLKDQGKTIFFSSHILADAEMISDRVGILNKGKLVKEMELFQLQSEKNLGLELTFQFFSEENVDTEKAPLEIDLFDQNGIIHLKDQKSIFDAVRWVEESGGTILSIAPKRKTLEDVFLEEMKN